jgi:hypothetical protein
VSETTLVPSATEPDPAEPDPTEPDPTEPDPTEPDPTAPELTEPERLGAELPHPGTVHLSRPGRAELARRVAVALGSVALLSVGWSVGAALATPGTDTVQARIAEWARRHDLGFLVNRLEQVQYAVATKPTAGGAPNTPIAVVGPAVVSPGVTVVKAHLGAPRPIPVPAGVVPVANEGRWQTVATVDGLPAVRVTQVRPDATYTSVLVGVAAIDTKLTRLTLHPGTQEPGGTWRTPSLLPPDLRASVLAAFNSGFTLGDNRGGLYLEGRTVKPLRTGAAALVIRTDGTASVGMWGRDAKPGADIAAVRQNLDLLVDGGRVDPTVDVNNTPKWGYTLGNKAFVPRSAVGVLADGTLVYVGGKAMSTRTLADLCARIGMVRAMELDINPEWVSLYWFASGIPHKLTPDVYKPADRYFSVSTRDFFSVQPR